MTTPSRTRLARRLATLATSGALAVAGAVVSVAATAAPADAARVTPGDFTGYGFDQCLAPTQSAMDAWLTGSPYWAVGIYISGNSRACRSQPNLTKTWVGTQLGNGWRLLPITLGPQASCNPRFPRYDDDPRIDASSARNYRKARLMGRREATKAVEAAQALGITAGSTLWYDMEAYDIANTGCRESALAFTSAWTNRLHRLDYVSGVYSSAGSHIVAMDDARVLRPDAYAMPDRIWFARWDGVATTSSSYLRKDGWLPGGRMKQYRGGHNETYNGVTINIDTNWLDLGRGSVAGPTPDHCNGVRLSYTSYPVLRAASTGTFATVAQCLLTERGFYDGPLDATMNDETREAVLAFRRSVGLPDSRVVGPAAWTALHAGGKTPLVKVGAAREKVRDLQRALNAAVAAGRPVTGVYDDDTAADVRRYQRELGLTQSGVVTAALWRRLQAGDL